MAGKNQAIVTVASGPHAGRLDHTFLTFARNKFANLHAFIIGDKLPERRFPEITYHLKPEDPSWHHPMRDIYYRRLLFIEELEEEFVLLVDNSDVLCLQDLPQIPELLRGAAFAACVEQAGGRYIAGQGYTSEYVNAGVTFWNVPASREMRHEIVERGRARFRSVDDQLTLNEVIQTRYYDQMIVLPCQYNFRPYYKFRKRGWPTVESLDGIKIFHNAATIKQAKADLPFKPLAELPPLQKDTEPLTRWDLFWRRVQTRLQPHIIR
jgi:lipopolysaccharide biosynthesis glycosyltransferase